MPPSWSAVVLAGGRGQRLGGTDKGALEIGGRTLLARALDAVGDAGEVVVVGEPAPTQRPVVFTRESPPYAGPAAGLLAGLDALRDVPPYLVVIAVDMPLLTAGTVHRLVTAAENRDGAVLIGPDGRRQLALALSTARLSEVRPDRDDAQDVALWRLLALVDLVEVPSIADEHRDVDTWSDLGDLD